MSGPDVAEVLQEQAARLRRLGGLHAHLGGLRHATFDRERGQVLAGMSGRPNAAGAFGWARALTGARAVACRTEGGDVLVIITGVLHPWLPPLEVTVSVAVGGEELLTTGAEPYVDEPVDLAVLRRLAQAQARQDKAWKTYIPNQRATNQREVLARFSEGLPAEVRAAIEGGLPA